MKSAYLASLLVSALYSQQAVAQSWNDQPGFPSPENCNNTCTSQQSGGYNFQNVPTGGFSGFDGMAFSGFSCDSSFNTRKGKRGLTRRTQFSGKAIVAKATTDDNCPNFSSGKDSAFSLTEIHISVDKDSPLTFEYGMPDGSTCQQVSQCSTEGTIVKNNQCGGAQHVNIKGDCTFGIHSMIFDCQPPPPPTTSTTTTSVPPTSQPTTTTTTTSLVCKSTEILTGGSCVPTSPPTTTSATTTPATTICAQTETLSQGKCIPTTSSTTTTTATVATTTSTTPSTTPSTTTTTTTSTTSTTSCAATETLYQGTCVPTTTTTTAATTTSVVITTSAVCATTETLISGKCVPLTTTVLPTTSCKDTETLSGTVCVSSTPSQPVTTLTSSLVTTEIVVTTLTTCPVTSTIGTITIVTSTISTTIITSTATFCPICGDHPPTTIATTTTQAPPPTTPPPTTAPPSVTTTQTCKKDETLQNGSCVRTPPPSSSTTPTTSPPSTPTCDESQTSSNGNCVPISTTTTSVTTTSPSAPPSTTTCNDSQTISNGICVSKPPTSGPTTSTSSSTTVNPGPPQPSPPDSGCPNLLPRCLSTWMSKAGSCASNSDVSCFCPNPDFITFVQECIQAWGGSEAEVQSAMSFLVGICANFVPQNPGICTGVPSTITLVPTPSIVTTTNTITINNGPQPTPPPPLPSTVITFSQTVTVGTTTTITQTVVTVPQVVFSTSTREVSAPNGGPPQTQTQGVGLVPFITTTTVGAQAGPTGGAGAPNVPAAPSTFYPSSTFGPVGASPAAPTNPIQTFTGAAPINAYSVVAAGLALLAFLI